MRYKRLIKVESTNWKTALSEKMKDIALEIEKYSKYCHVYGVCMTKNNGF
jgi:hypothetical protein